MRIFLLLYLCAFGLAQIALADDDPGHSAHGSAFDSGMRTRPWVMKGIGSAPFPITSKNPEVQQWFDQGNVLLHSFWFEEAERSFRWCLKLDPDCAMAYWGLARCGFTWFVRGATELPDKEYDRYRKFLNEAVKRKDKVSERERMYIDAWAVGFAPVVKDRTKVLASKIEEIALKFPDDNEAKAQLCLTNIGQGSPLANEMLIQQVLAKNPMHPGALHASIHNWDAISNDQALKACALYGKSAPNVGHALHMPGHIYSKVGMWHEAAIAMDSATRTELRYMNDRLALPFETWNYSHNRNYLCYIQEQLGMADESIQGARDLLAAPRDPDYNPTDNGSAAEGTTALVRALIKFERWDEILRPKSIAWPSGEFARSSRDFAEALAFAHSGKRSEARTKLEDLKAVFAKFDKDAPEFSGYGALLYGAVEGQLLVLEGKLPEGRAALARAAAAEEKVRANHQMANDPPDLPWPVMRLLGDLDMRMGYPYMAIADYEKALVNEPNDGFSLSGLALAYSSLGDRSKASYYAGRLKYEWSNASPSLKWIADVDKLGLIAKPIAETKEPERTYRPADLASFGPSNWQPYPAPTLDVIGAGGKKVSLQDYRGKNVLLVFFLGSSCVHCVQQLEAINKRMSEFEKDNTVVLAVCSAKPEVVDQSRALKDVRITVLSDTNHENARRFASYDDFEEIELHSTILIDGSGKVRWKRTGGDPFSNIDFLLGEIARVNSAATSK